MHDRYPVQRTRYPTVFGRRGAVATVAAMARFPWSTALVTGASSGIGRAIVGQLAEADVAVVAVARRGDRLQELAARFAQVEPLVADLETATGRGLVTARLADPERGVELLVNSAGYGASGAFWTVDLDHQLGQVELNVAALTELTHAALGLMVARSRGWVLNVASVVGFQAAPSSATYGATKAYVISLTEALAEEVRGHGVHVSALCPGLTRTEFHERFAPGGGSGTENTTTTGDSGAAAKLGRQPRPLGVWMTADAVAAIGLAAAARGQVLVVPGAANKALVTGSALAPRRLRRRIAGLATRRRY